MQTRSLEYNAFSSLTHEQLCEIVYLLLETNHLEVRETKYDDSSRKDYYIVYIGD